MLESCSSAAGFNPTPARTVRPYYVAAAREHGEVDDGVRV